MRERDRGQPGRQARHGSGSAPRPAAADHQVTARVSSPRRPRPRAAVSPSLVASHRAAGDALGPDQPMGAGLQFARDQRRAPERADDRRRDGDGDDAGEVEEPVGPGELVEHDRRGDGRPRVAARSPRGRSRPRRPRPPPAAAWMRNCRQVSQIIAAPPAVGPADLGAGASMYASTRSSRVERADGPGRVEDGRRRCGRRASSAGRCGWPRRRAGRPAASGGRGAGRSAGGGWRAASRPRPRPGPGSRPARRRWSQTRSRSETRCEDSTTLKLVLGDRLHQALQELAPGQRVEAGDRLVEEQQLRPLGQAEGQRELGPLAAGQLAGLLGRVEAEPLDPVRGPARRPSAG